MTTNRKPYSRPSTPPSKTIFGQRLKAERIRRGFQIEIFAERIGTCASQIAGYENRNVMPRIDILIAVAVLLDCSTDWLLGLED